MKLLKLILLNIIFLAMSDFCFSQLKGTLIDLRDSTEYKIVKIGNNWWMAENLLATVYNDGTQIPLITDKTDWIILETPAYCWYNSDEAFYKSTYGALYNWYTIDYNNICPTGWHIPSDTEWKQLEQALGLTESEVDEVGIRGINQGGLLKAIDTTYWKSPNTDASNMSGFGGMPGGHRNWASGEYIDLGLFGTWWASSEEDSIRAWRRTLHYNDGKIRRFSSHKRDGFSVRCIKD